MHGQIAYVTFTEFYNSILPPEDSLILKHLRLSLLPLAIGVGSMLVFVNAQQPVPNTQTQVARAEGTGELLRKYNEISSLPAPERRTVFTNASASEKSGLWRVHLALFLVKRPELSQGQKGIVLDAISLASPEFFTGMTGRPEARSKGEDAMRSLSQRALSAFPKDEAAEIFANLGGGKVEDDLLQKYNQISALAMKQRKAAFRSTSTVDKSNLWRTHLALFLARRSDLNELQKEIVLTAMSVATPRVFELRADRTALHALEDRAIVAFTREDGAKIFATLGDDAPATTSNVDQGNPAPSRTVANLQTNGTGPYTRWAHISSAGQDIELDKGDCVCSRDSDWCPIYGHCNGTVCTVTSSGCGTFWTYSCNGASCQ